MTTLLQLQKAPNQEVTQTMITEDFATPKVATTHDSSIKFDKDLVSCLTKQRSRFYSQKLIDLQLGDFGKQFIVGAQTGRFHRRYFGEVNSLPSELQNAHDVSVGEGI